MPTYVPLKVSLTVGIQCISFYSARDRGAEYCNERVCVSLFLCVCPSAIISSAYALHEVFALVTYGRGSVLLWRRSDTLRISGYIDDVIFAHTLRLLDVAARLRQ